MTELQKEFEATGYTSWINADLYSNGKIYTQEYTQWLEKQVLALRQPPVISCVCPNEIKTGTVSIHCCNLCGKPDEDWWGKH